MKALTITQPWATLVALRAKRIETRSWPTNYRGPLAIHAAKGFPRWARETCDEEPFVGALGNLDPNGLLRGYVVATCHLVDCLLIEDGWWLALHSDHLRNYFHGHEKAFGGYEPGRFAWILDFIDPLNEPRQACGALGLWEWPHASQ